MGSAISSLVVLSAKREQAGQAMRSTSVGSTLHASCISSGLQVLGLTDVLWNCELR